MNKSKDYLEWEESGYAFVPPYLLGEFLYWTSKEISEATGTAHSDVLKVGSACIGTEVEGKSLKEIMEQTKYEE